MSIAVRGVKLIPITYFLIEFHYFDPTKNSTVSDTKETNSTAMKSSH